MAAETQEQLNARISAWQQRKESGDPFPGPVPFMGDGVVGTETGPQQFVDPTSPGASLNTSQPDADRLRLAGYLKQLTTQSQTGGGAWEQALAQNTARAKGVAQSLGQSPGIDPMTAARGIGNAQAGADQRSVGQGNLLRAQTQQRAQGQLADVLGGQGALDAQQGSTQQAAGFGLTQLEHTLRVAGDKKVKDALGSTAQGYMSKGGTVPGVPLVPGDDIRNDIVPAKSTEGADLKLSPGEIIIPNSITQRPDAATAAAAFVAAVKARGPQHQQRAFAPGGEVGDAFKTGQAQRSPVFTPVSTRNPTPIDATSYNQTRDASIANSGNLLASYNGKGPSTAPQEMQNATDSTIADAMRAQAGAHRPLDVTAAGAEQAQGAAGNAAGVVAGESQHAGDAFAAAVQKQRAQDLSLATAQQQAAWRNTMTNAGVTLEQQAQLQNLIGGAGQAAAGVSGLFTNKPRNEYHYDTGTGRYDTTPAWENPGNGSSPGEWEQPFAEGGVVSHLARQGTRSKMARPGKREGVTDFGTGKTGGTGDASEWNTYDKGSEQDPRTQREADGTEQYFADGGSVAGEPNMLSRFLEYMGSPVRPPALPGVAPDMSQLPEPRMMTQDEIASADSRNTLPPQQPPKVDTAARERPFIAKPAPMAAPKPVAPVAAKATPIAPSIPKPPDADSLAMTAGRARADIESGQAADTNAALGELQRGIEQSAIQQNERHARATQQAQSQMDQIQMARDEMKRVDTTIDEGKWWADRSVPGKIAAVIGLALGAIGNDNGVNRAAQLIQQQVDRSIDAQKASHELALRKGQANVSSAENLYAMTRQMTQDDVAADSASRATLYDLAKNKVDIAAAKAGAPLAKQKLLELSATLAAKKDEKDVATKQRGFDNSIKKQNADSDRMRAEADAVAAGNKAATGDKTQQALLATVQTEEGTIQKQGDALLKLIDKHGTSESDWLGTPGVEAQMRQAVDNMAIAASKLKDPNSAAKESEVAGERKNIFEPGILKNKAAARAAIESYMANGKQRAELAFSARGMASPGVGPPQAPSSGPQVGEVRENSKTKKRIKWTGSEWAPL